jgi:glutamine synthetase
MDKPSDPQSIADALAAQGIHTLLLQFTDLQGVAKGKLMPLHQLATVLRTGAGFAGPSIVGTGLPRTGPRSEYYARGDLQTLQALPWLPGVARIIGDGYVADQPFDACPRQILRRALARLAERGWTLQVGIEPEFFLLRRTAEGYAPFDLHDRLDKPSYDLSSLLRQWPLLHALREWLEACGLTVLQIDHEDAQGQFEINFLHAEALTSADRLMLFKLAAHAIAEQQGAVFSMMPKPFSDQPGSGMHFHVSLWQDGRCLFDATHAHHDLSPLGEQFVAGVLEHSPGLCALAAPTVNSYRRLGAMRSLSGSTWAPTVVAHGPNNRTALIRTLPGRFEWRLPDAAANPYLALAGLIAAGLDGIERGLAPPPACHADLVVQPGAAPATLALPGDLAAAADALQADPVLREALGEVATEQLATLQREAQAQCVAACGGYLPEDVSTWELAAYAERG